MKGPSSREHLMQGIESLGDGRVKEANGEKRQALEKVCCTDEVEFLEHTVLSNEIWLHSTGSEQWAQ